MALLSPQPTVVDTEHRQSMPVVFQDENGQRRSIDVNDPLPVTPTAPSASTSTTAATLTQAVKTVAASGTPEALGSGLVESVAIRPNKARGTANTGNVYVGFGATNDTQQLWELTPTASPITLSAPAGKKIDLSTIYIDVVTNGDGVVYFAVN